ncbi:hypothetical protein, partial [Amycolatopsis sp. NPDC003676]
GPIPQHCSGRTSAAGSFPPDLMLRGCRLGPVSQDRSDRADAAGLLLVGWYRTNVPAGLVLQDCSG